MPNLNWQRIIKTCVMHIRKAHAETPCHFKGAEIQARWYCSHAFSGGVEEAKALVKLGFKIGVTGKSPIQMPKSCIRWYRRLALNIW